MTKQEAEWTNSLKISWLKKHGYLDGGYKSGGIKWTYSGGKKNDIGFYITTGSNDDNIILHYTQTNRSTGEKEDMNYVIKLTTTPCNYGGKRYWFICPLIKNGKRCGRRVGVLFNIGKWFGCRHCGDIAYSSQMQGGKFRYSICQPDVDRAEKDIKRYHYNGKPTRKYRRFLRMNEKLDQSFITMASLIDKSFRKFTNLGK